MYGTRNIADVGVYLARESGAGDQLDSGFAADGVDCRNASDQTFGDDGYSSAQS